MQASLLLVKMSCEPLWIDSPTAHQVDDREGGGLVHSVTVAQRRPELMFSRLCVDPAPYGSLQMETDT